MNDFNPFKLKHIFQMATPLKNHFRLHITMETVLLTCKIISAFQICS